MLGWEDEKVRFGINGPEVRARVFSGEGREEGLTHGLEEPSPVGCTRLGLGFFPAPSVEISYPSLVADDFDEISGDEGRIGDSLNFS